MTNAELIKALRRCSYTTVAGADREDGYCKPCAYFAEDTSDVTCIDRMMIDAADALEAAEAEKVKLNTKCADLQSQINSMESEIEELLPKEGEWIECEDLESAMKGKVVCSNCKEPQCSIEMTPGAIRLKNEKTKYCPNCGAKMKGANDEADC